jgi:hypothetical protein
MRRYRVDSPCDIRWEELEPREGGRYCGRCNTLVRDLARASEAEAAAWLENPERQTRICARINPDSRGFAVLRSSRVALGAALIAGLAGCDGDATGERPAAEQVQTEREAPLPVGGFIGIDEPEEPPRERPSAASTSEANDPWRDDHAGSDRGDLPQVSDQIIDPFRD